MVVIYGKGDSVTWPIQNRSQVGFEFSLRWRGNLNARHMYSERASLQVMRLVAAKRRSFFCVALVPVEVSTRLTLQIVLPSDNTLYQLLPSQVLLVTVESSFHTPGRSVVAGH